MAKSNHKDFDNKKDAIAFLKKNALMSVGWPEGGQKKVAIYWNGRLHVEKAETKKIWGSSMNDVQAAKELVAAVKELTALTVPERHQKAIALDTLKLSDAGVKIMGGMTKEEARAFLKKIGYSDSKIRRLEASGRTARVDRKIVTVDWNDTKSIKNAERQKARLENAGYSLIQTTGGLFTTKLFYEKSASRTADLSLDRFPHFVKYYEKVAREVQRIRGMNEVTMSVGKRDNTIALHLEYGDEYFGDLQVWLRETGTWPEVDWEIGIWKDRTQVAHKKGSYVMKNKNSKHEAYRQLSAILKKLKVASRTAADPDIEAVAEVVREEGFMGLKVGRALKALGMKNVDFKTYDPPMPGAMWKMKNRRGKTIAIVNKKYVNPGSKDIVVGQLVVGYL